MIAVDTNVLVQAHRRDAPRHDGAVAAVAGLAQGSAPWAIPCHCLHEFFGVVTHPRVFDPPSTVEEALGQIDAWMASPSVRLLAEEGSSYWQALREVLGSSRAVGAKVHDARIAAACLCNGVRELWTADRDFSRFAGLAVRNPLLG